MSGSKYVPTSCACTIQVHARSIPKGTLCRYRIDETHAFPVQPFLHLRPRYRYARSSVPRFDKGSQVGGNWLLYTLKRVPSPNIWPLFLKAVGIMGIHPRFHRSFGPIADLRCGVWMMDDTLCHAARCTELQPAVSRSCRTKLA